MNWGSKIIIGMALFMSFIILLGIMMVRSTPDPLVDEDYYEKGLNYDQELRVKQHRLDSIRAQGGTANEQ
ncbi:MULTISPECIES: FixH family protein [Pedobacter]|uniref:FixH family protein n=1 Tax=Pedobacter TaxID=84567 RepID=UPI00210C73A4|nr:MULTISPECIES: FixH family protein [unclassified Pedobacter]